MPNIAWLAVWLIVIGAMIAMGIRDVRRDRRRSRAESARRVARPTSFVVPDEAAPSRPSPAGAGELDPA
jgi:ABC-type Co2+ transport system permease subunit